MAVLIPRLPQPLWVSQKLPVYDPYAFVDDDEQDSAQQDNGEHRRHPDSQKHQRLSSPGGIAIDYIEGVLDA